MQEWEFEVVITVSRDDKQVVEEALRRGGHEFAVNIGSGIGGSVEEVTLILAAVKVFTGIVVDLETLTDKIRSIKINRKNRRQPGSREPDSEESDG